MKALLNERSEIACPHGGTVVARTSNRSLALPDAPCLIETDVLAVAGCPFVLPGPKPSPCVRVKWSRGSERIAVDGVGVLTTGSVGVCESAEGVAQGSAVVLKTQSVVFDD